MSLDFYVRVPKEDTRIFLRENGKTFSVIPEDCSFEYLHVGNITHNLGEMARHIPVSKELKLYNVLWRPEELDLTTTDSILEYVDTGVRYMLKNKKKLEKYNPDNGWGNYDGLLSFAKKVGSACLFNSGCEIEANR